jgi:molybdopterin converting factor subunit 1
MHVRVLLFATYREVLGEREVPWTIHEGETLGEFVDSFLMAHAKLAAHRKSMLLAVNEAYANPSVILHDGDEVALLPPVSGGAR